MPKVHSGRIMSAVSHVLLLVAVLFSSASAEKSVSQIFRSESGTSGRVLQNAATTETDEPINELLIDACNLPNGVEEFLESGATSGEVCQLAASVIGRGNSRTYEFSLQEHHDGDLSFQVVLQPLEGETTVSFEHQGTSGAWSTVSTEEWSSGDSLIYVVKELKYGTSRVVLESISVVSTFSLRIEFFTGGTAISETSATVLTFFKEKCCDGDAGPCTGVLTMPGTSEEANICDSAGNHCDADGHLTHLDLSESNMHCDLSEINFLASGLSQLQVFMLNDNDIQGDISNEQVLENLAALTRLEILELGNLPGVTGSIPPSCTAPFTNLIHLGVSNTSIGGTVPPCIVNTVHQLEISNAQFSGEFPEITASAKLRYLLAETDPDSEFKFTGAFPNLEFAVHLHYANLNYHSFEGTLTLANNIEAVLAEGNMLTELRVPSANRLQFLDVAGNQLTGEITPELAQLTNLLSLHVDGNQFDSLPSAWATDNLRDFTAAKNQITGNLPTLFADMPHLRRLILSGNQMSGELDDFSAAIPQHSKLQWLDISSNKFSGELFAPALIKLAVFSSQRDEYQSEFDRRALHVFDASDNKLIGAVSEEILQAYEEQVLAGADVHVDFRGNSMSCPESEVLERSNLDAEQITALGCSSSGGSGTATRAVVGVLSAVVLLGLIALCAVLYKRRQSRKGWYRDERSSATAYVNGTDASARTTGGWFTGKPDDNKQFAAGLDEPTGGNGMWGFMPFMRRSKQPVSQLLGGWSRTETEGHQSLSNASAGGMQLPVSGARRDMHVKVPSNGYKQAGAAVTSVELASPMSDVSANSLPRNGGGLIDGDDRDDVSDHGGGNMRGVFGNSAYAPVSQDPK